MSKIVAVHVGERQKSFSLIQQVDEASAKEIAGKAGKAAKSATGWLKNIANKTKELKSAFDSEYKGDNSASDSTEPAERSKPDNSDVSALSTIASEILTVPAGENRVVIFLQHIDLKAHYLVKGGGQKLVDALTDAEISEIQGTIKTESVRLTKKSLIAEAEDDLKVSQADAINTEPEPQPVPDLAPKREQKRSNRTAEFAFLGRTFTFTDLIKPPKESSNLDRAVLINAPPALLKEIKGAASIEAARIALKKLMSHNIYVLTLNLKNARAIEPAMNMGETIDDKAKEFNPNVLENYPHNSRWGQAKKEWQSGVEATPKEMTDDERREAEVAKKEKEAEWAERERSADAKKSGPATDENSEILNIIVKAGDTFKAANSLQGWAKPKGMAKTDLMSRLDTLAPRYQNIKIPDVIEKLQKMRFD